ncbi:aldehyde dehydrogenase domain-containing protein [Boeremia exigua]|uniref:aldehyde dehydrogenase domain-containing protein n=1 Tax=Boeremia exigua TaxID=749465 RepID=UPI001E8E9890|nr:aldehyde dehydrogenase domain-containing protein [Boeremia exigua]KAH6643083.1 aldehyde dehydrogenase domain-containing protein [Boeremia exigua]
MSPGKVSTLDFEKFYNVVNGENRGSDQIHHGINPATSQELWDVPIGSNQDLNDAVAAAKKAFPAWRDTPVAKRKEALGQLIALFQQHEDEFVSLLCKESGKPRKFAAIEVSGVAGFIGYHTTLDVPSESFEDDEKTVYTEYSPLGVCAAICPWNFPLILSVGKIAPAIMTGNCIIVKPSPFTPYTSLKFVELAQQVFPPGVLQVVGGNNELGAEMCKHPDIAKISFTGSIATGKKVMETSAKTLKRVTLELGGNDASIILPDVDIKKIAPEVVMGAFQNSGQVCVATKRIYIHESIYKEFVEEMVNYTKTIKVGNPDDGDNLLGPVQNKMQYDRVKGFFEDSKSKGYTFAVGSADVAPSKGYFIQPTIVDNPPNDSRIIQEEPFGPIVPTQPWSDLEEVIARANDTNTGLGATVWGKDVEKACKIARRLEAGSVFVNSYEKPTPQAVFGGHKESGIGGEWGKTGLLAYCNPHVIHVYKS